MEQLRSFLGSFSPLGYRGSRVDSHDLGTLAGATPKETVGNVSPKLGVLMMPFVEEYPSKPQ